MNDSTKEKFVTEDYVGKAKPDNLPNPTYWPFVFALGLTLSFWGILTGWIICISGSILLFIALAGWIKEINHEEQ